MIFYETPTYGVHHFSPNFWKPAEQVNAPLKKPKWLDELCQKQPLNDLDTIILSINCAAAAAAKIVHKKHMGSKRSSMKFPNIHRINNFTSQLLAFILASLSTLVYMFVQFFCTLLSFGSQPWISSTSTRILSSTHLNVQIRCCQILYWPMFLQDNDLRSQSCVEFAEKAALHKHSMWSSLVIDVLLGNLIGLGMLFYAESICLWILNFSSYITNEFLRSGCVWLMGVPAGFKLNTELAGVLGMISLNAIQIWSTIWTFVGSLIIHFIRALALLGIFFGVTIPAALFIDIMTLVTLHVSALHWLIALLYSQQIQALAALWRLFRGRKWNPLRERLDSYGYTVKQHIVGSLLFTPLLLLLPTTSVFYIFFTMISTLISSVSILIEIAISIIHATPYIKIFLWLVRRRRFPSGIWFEIMTCKSDTPDSQEVACLRNLGPPSEGLQGDNFPNRKASTVLVSTLRSNLLSIGQVLLPHYKKVFSGISGSFSAISAYGVLTGRRMPSTLGVGLPSTMPWMSVPFKQYWCLCRNSILSCMADHNNHLA